MVSIFLERLQGVAIPDCDVPFQSDFILVLQRVLGSREDGRQYLKQLLGLGGGGGGGFGCGSLEFSTRWYWTTILSD
jgi:hypothetical protein